jgi:virulence factor Mce-like protein
MQKVNPNSSRGERLWGTAGMAVVTIVALALALLYVRPPDQKIVTFYTDDAASIRPGDTVRIAGIVVGKVKDLSIEPQQIRVRASLNRAAFVGDQSQVQVRMLTVVGGYYVTLVPLGKSPLGGRPIPKERVTTPYSLMQTLADATKITEGVAPKPIRESIDQLQRGLVGNNVNSVTAVLDAGNSITDTLTKQRGAVSKILKLSDEYIDTLANYRGRLQEYIRKLAILEETLILYGKSFGDGIAAIGSVGWALMPALDTFVGHSAYYEEKVHNILSEFRTVAGRTGVVVRVLGRIHDRMEIALDKQDNFIRPELLATDICMPVHGSPC